VRGVGKLQVQYGKALRRITSLPGRFSLLGPGFEQKPVAWTGVREMLFVAIGAQQLEHLVGQEPALACLNVDPHYGVSDPHVVSLVLNIRDEIRAGCPTGRLYGESLSLALAAYLLKRYAHKTSPERRCEPALSPLQVRRVREYIRCGEHFGQVRRVSRRHCRERTAGGGMTNVNEDLLDGVKACVFDAYT